MAGGLVAGPRMRPVHASLVVEGIMERRPDPEWWPLPPLARRPDLRVDKAARTCYFRSADWPWWRSIYVHTYEHTCLHAYIRADMYRGWRPRSTPAPLYFGFTYGDPYSGHIVARIYIYDMRKHRRILLRTDRRRNGLLIYTSPTQSDIHIYMQLDPWSQPDWAWPVGANSPGKRLKKIIKPKNYTSLPVLL